MAQLPQVLLNVQVRAPLRSACASLAFASAVGDVESQLGERGRVVLRASGTEPVIRVMVEGEDR